MAIVTAALVNATFWSIAVVAGAIFLLGRICGNKAGVVKGGPEFDRFQLHYLAVYLLASFCDWLQGAYVYALYASYGFSDSENGQLFVAGFGASMMFGTFAGSLADKTGRRKGALLYCVLYGISCATKHVSSFWVLMVGRLTGGIATSLLFSVFDSWMVSEHSSRGFDPALLGHTFGLAVFANSITAIVAGKVAQFAADMMPLNPPAGPTAQFHVGGNLGPFDVSIAGLCICTLLLQALWSENYGDRANDDAAGFDAGALKAAAVQTVTKPELLCCGIVCSFFEASMFIFVFKWTPVVTDPEGPIPPYGDIFATFMLACMLGSQVYAVISNYMCVERLGICLLLVAASAHAAVVFSTSASGGFFAFLVIEGCVGMYFPMIGTLKGAIVPEGMRATIYNLYRVPLNFAVCSTLLMKLSVTSTFVLTTLLLLCALAAQGVLSCLRQPGVKYKSVEDASVSVEMGETVPPSTIGTEEPDQ